MQYTCASAMLSGTEIEARRKLVRDRRVPAWHFVEHQCGE
jgi:hypothetical protein